MKMINIANGPQNVSAIVQGCMRMPALSKEDPARMQAIIGTMNPAHIKDICAAADVTLSHHDWYALYLASGKFLP